MPKLENSGKVADASREATESFQTELSGEKLGTGKAGDLDVPGVFAKNRTRVEKFNSSTLDPKVRDRYSPEELRRMENSNVIISEPINAETSSGKSTGPLKAEAISLEKALNEISELKFPERPKLSTAPVPVTGSPLDKMKANIDVNEARETYNAQTEAFNEAVRSRVSLLMESGVKPQDLIEGISREFPYDRQDLKIMKIHDLVAAELRKSEIRKIFDPVREFEVNENTPKTQKLLGMTEELNKLQGTIRELVASKVYSASEIDIVARSLFNKGTLGQQIILSSVRAGLEP